jgi:hypothetical protein
MRTFTCFSGSFSTGASPNWIKGQEPEASGHDAGYEGVQTLAKPNDLIACSRGRLRWGKPELREIKVVCELFELSGDVGQ